MIDDTRVRTMLSSNESEQHRSISEENVGGAFELLNVKSCCLFYEKPDTLADRKANKILGFCLSHCLHLVLSLAVRLSFSPSRCRSLLI